MQGRNSELLKKQLNNNSNRNSAPIYLMPLNRPVLDSRGYRDIVMEVLMVSTLYLENDKTDESRHFPDTINDESSSSALYERFLLPL